jgi:predicted nucleic acid-binding protein
VTVFLDTSVIVAASRSLDARYEASQRILCQCQPETSFSAAHCIAETYTNLTGIQPPYRVRPAQAIQILQHLSTQLTLISLAPDEVLGVCRRTAEIGLIGGVIYDALILACARKVKAEHIYTWNERHFKMAAPDLADRIVRP